MSKDAQAEAGATTPIRSKPLAQSLSLRSPETGFVLKFLGLTAVLYGITYFPYDVGSAPQQFRESLFALTASCSGALIGLFDNSVSVSETVIRGAFPLRIVLGCAALDAMALCTAAVIAFPARWPFRVFGVFACNLLILVANQGRIAALYFAGAASYETFRILHEEVFVVITVLLALFSFLAWLRLGRYLDQLTPLKDAMVNDTEALAASAGANA